MLDRFRNKALWVAIAAFVLLLLQTFGVHVAPEQYTTLINSLLSLLVLAGILNDPTSGQWFEDKK